jgi:PAS domain S-box-containing protein
MQPHALKSRFLSQIRDVAGMATVFDYLPDVYLFVKDAEGRFVFTNRAFLKLVGASREDEVIGRRDPDFFPPHLCENYAKDDRAVLATGRPIVDRVELVRNPDGSIDWFNTTKAPVFTGDGRVIAVAGVTRDLKKMRSASGRFLEMAPVLETIMNEYAEPLSVRALAAKVGLSVSQFERQFKKKFGTTPRRYITQVRLKAACELLAETDLPIAQIAADTGFYDQSHLTNHFVRQFAVTPHRYRAQRGTRGAPDAR